ncbi:uncharacterized protein BJ212DRAFT_1482357 [Suillus subaureus]|uniref:Uncharacterized protein n=1 Tax=Suillus subaureus TaxID=48587 RepID=A0A9P7JC78_9AGAM|nr:uncharacterized protein BJ212DRAFT_1482357 [Suillus subaureus]KAG1814012.1 hypothetical protein BJ212DRAFT_1482357 [Suillus subaureus]
MFAVLQGFKQMLKLTKRQWSCPQIHPHPVEEGNLEDPPKPARLKRIVHWTRAQDLHCTDTLVTHLTTNPSNACTLFYKGKKTTSSSTEEHPSGRDKGDIHQILSKLIFKNDSKYSALYAEDPKKFDVSVATTAPHKKLFRDQHNKFNKTGAGITPLDEHAATNLHKQVLLKSPWYDQLHPFLFSNPTIGVKIFTSQPEVDHTTNYYSLVCPHGGAGPSTNPPSPQLPQLHPQNPQPHPPDPQPLPPDPQLPLWSPPDTSTQCVPLSIQPCPMGAQHTPPSTLHPPPPHFSSTGGSPIDNPDGDLDDDPHTNENNPFFAPLGNTLGMLGRGDVDMDNDNGMELDSSHHRVISLDSPPSGKAPDTNTPQLQGIWLSSLPLSS